MPADRLSTLDTEPFRSERHEVVVVDSGTTRLDASPTRSADPSEEAATSSNQLGCAPNADLERLSDPVLRKGDHVVTERLAYELPTPSRATIRRRRS